MGPESPTVDAVQRRTKVGRGTVQRIKEGETSIGTDKLLAIADAFNVEPWTLLHPTLDETVRNLETPASPPPTLAQALDVVMDALAKSPTKAELKQLLPMLVDTNAAAYRARLGELLGQATDKFHQARDPQDFPPEILPTHQADIDARVAAAQEQHEQKKHSRSLTQKRSA